MKISGVCGQQKVSADYLSVEDVVRAARAVGASDIHLEVGREPAFRIAGHLLSSSHGTRWDADTMNREVLVLLGGDLPADGYNFAEYCAGAQRTRVFVRCRGSITTANIRLLPDIAVQ